MNTVSKQIKNRIEKMVRQEKFELVECKISNSRGILIIKCLVDYPEGGITVDKCGRLNRQIAGQLQESFSGLDFTVEVHSPGLDRPLKTQQDFLKAKGRDILLWLKEPVLGKQFIEARVEDVNPESLILVYKDNSISVCFDQIKLGKHKFRN